MIAEAQKMITTIRQMEVSLDDSRSRRTSEDDDLQITYPLTRCLQLLKEKHIQISRLHKERFEQVKSACRFHPGNDVFDFFLCQILTHFFFFFLVSLRLFAC